MWIFGYGSLIWRPDFLYTHRRPGFIKGWTRRFWQGSTDHRGTPELPGRVVTLLPEPKADCWGMAYQIDPDQARHITARLDHREQGGYTHHLVDVHPHPADPDSTPIEQALVYIATPHNPHYLGPAPPDEIIERVRAAHDPSGANVDYLLNLARALRDIDAADPHVFELEALLMAR